MEINFFALLAAAASTLVVGFIWYNPKVFGTIWMNESGMTEEKMKGANMPLIFGLSLVYAFFIAFILQFLTIHQYGVFGLVEGNANDLLFITMMETHGNMFRSFGHGALHGFMAGLFLALPLIATNSLYERRSWKYSLVTGGFWIVCFIIMGGIICAWK